MVYSRLALFHTVNAGRPSPRSGFATYDSTKHFQVRKELPASPGKGDSQSSPIPESWTVPRDDLSPCSQLEDRPTAAKWLDINTTFEQSSKLPKMLCTRTKPYLPHSWFCLEGKYEVSEFEQGCLYYPTLSHSASISPLFAICSLVLGFDLLLLQLLERWSNSKV